MPTAQYTYDVTKEPITKKMLTPKRITKLEAWYKEAAKAIKELPQALMDVYGENDWMIEHAEPNQRWIKYDLRHKSGKRAYLTILRH